VVGELVDHMQGVWKRELIKEVFMPEEAHVIENIPLSPCLPLDRLIWKETKDGQFTVRNAYHLRKHMLGVYREQSSNEVKDTPIQDCGSFYGHCRFQIR
jgi:hypothetical protein